MGYLLQRCGSILVGIVLWLSLRDSGAALPNFDKRRAGRGEPALERQTARGQGDFVVSMDLVTGSPRSIRAPSGFLAGTASGIHAQSSTNAGSPVEAMKALIRTRQDLFNHGPELMDQLALQQDYATPHNGMRTVRWQQNFEGVAVFEGLISAQFDRAGRLLSLSSGLIANPLAAAHAGNGDYLARLKAPPISATNAVEIAALHLGAQKPSKLVASGFQGIDQKGTFRGLGLKGEARVRLAWLPMNPGAARLCWVVELRAGAHAETYRLVIDAASGEVLLRQSLTFYLSDATYRVFTSHSPTPLSPGYASPSAQQPALVERQRAVLSALSTNASPAGWIDDRVNETLGNNVDAHTDWNDDDEPDLPRPHGFPRRVFDFPLDLSESPKAYANASVVQLFYWNNWMHDRLYELGFTEAAGNFQASNFGRGGEENDAVQADAQDGGGFNNANFTVLEDGVPGRMQMYVFDGPKPGRDGALDADVVLHEYTHGLTGRLIGNGYGLESLQAGGLGEGWSDFYALTFLSAPTDDPAAAYPAGAYASYLLDGLEANYYYGIRRYPYSTDLRKNPLTLKDIDPTQASPHLGIPENPTFAGSDAADEVHSQGEVWCSALWEVRAAFIRRYGFSAGNQAVLQLATDALRLTPSDPTFLDARDAIIQADLVNHGGANAEMLWTAFAKRGFGFGAQVPPGDTTVGVAESFDIPDDLVVSPAQVVTSSGPVGGAFAPAEGVLSLRNVSTNTVRWSAISSGPIVRLSADHGEIPPGSAPVEVRFTFDPVSASLPAGIYTETLTWSNAVTRRIQTRVVNLRIGQPEYWTRLFSDATEAAVFRNASVTFTPEDSLSQYRACSQPAEDFPVDPAAATELALGDDSFVPAAIGGTFPFFGVEYTNVFVGANGYLTFGRGAVDFLPSLASHFGGPRISAYSTDLNPSFGGRISSLQLPDRLAITFEQVASYFDPGDNSFQVELFFDGTIRITWLQTTGTFGLVGLSQGGGVPAGFTPTAFGDLGSCRPALNLAGPSSVREDAGAFRLAVSIPSPLTTNLTIHLESENVKVPLTTDLVLAAGETRLELTGAIRRNTALEGTTLVRFVATADGYQSGAITVNILDAETNTLSVVLPGNASEGDSTPLTGRVEVDRAAPEPLLVRLTSGDPARLAAPPVCIVPANALSANFPLTVLDDQRINSNLEVTVTASIENWLSGAGKIVIRDNEARDLRISAPKNVAESSALLSGVGVVSVSGLLDAPLAVALRSDRPELLSVPETVVIPAGRSNITFDLQPHRDAVPRGTQTIQVSLSAPGFSPAAAQIALIDDQTPAVPFGPHPLDGSTNNPPRLRLSWSVGNGELLENGGFETGQLGPWKSEGTGGGRFSVNDGSLDPDGPGGAVAPFAGKFSVVSEESAPGRITLYQIVAIPPGLLGAQLRWRDRIFNYAGLFDDHLQSFRVEAQSEQGDTLATLFRTRDGDSVASDWTQREVDLGDFQGKRVRVAFVVDVTLGYLNVHLDDIELNLSSAPVAQYSVRLGTTRDAAGSHVLGATTNSFWDLPPLDLNQTYYWSIVAEGPNASVPGPVWSFTVPPAGSVDHFAWTPLPSRTFAETALSGQIEARDIYGNVATNFSGSVRLRGRVALPAETVGIGSEAWEFPLGGFLPVARVQTIYLAPELGGRRVITGISLNVKEAPGELTQWTIRLKHTALARYSSSASFDRSGWTTVLQRTLQIDEPGWAFIPFTTPFEFNGASNLLIDFSFKNAQSGASGVVFAQKTDEDRSLVGQSFSGNPLTAGSDFYPAPISLAPQVQIVSELPVPILPVVTGVFTNGIWAGPIALSGSGDDLQLVAEDSSGHSGLSSLVSADFTNDLRVVVLSAPQTLFQQDTGVYKFQVINPGPGAASGVLLSNRLVGAGSVQSAVSSVGTVDTSSTVVSARIGDLPAGSNAVVSVNVLATPGTSRVITLVAGASRNEPDGKTNNNSVSVMTAVGLRPAVSVSDAQAVEGPTNQLVFYLELSKASPQLVSVDYATVPGTASADDFEMTSGTVAFAPGSRTAQIEVAVRDDQVDETDETFTLQLSNPTNAALAVSTATGTIIDDENPEVSVEDASILEGTDSSPTLSFNFRLSTNTVDTVQVAWETIPLTAGSSDFQMRTGLVVFPPGSTVQQARVQIVADAEVEPDERFVIKIDSATGARVGRGRAYGTILNDDGLPGDIDRLAFGSIAPPTFVGEAFPVTLRALDASNLPATNFNGFATLAASIEQPAVEIGAHDSTVNAPLDTSFMDLRLEAIYPRAEVGPARTLTGLGLYVLEVPAATLQRFTIRLKHTSLAEFSDAPVWESAGWTTVYQGDVALTRTGLVSFAFSQPFAYDGTRNLLVDFSFQNDAYDFTLGMVSATVHDEGRIILGQSDHEDGDPLRWSGEQPFTFPDYTVPDLQITSAIPVGLSTNRAGPFTNGVWSGAIAVSAPANGLVLTAHDGQKHAGSSSKFDVVLRNDLSLVVLPEIEPVTVSSAANYRVEVANTGPLLSTGLVVTNDLPKGALLVTNWSSTGFFTANGNQLLWSIPSLAGGERVVGEFVLKMPDSPASISGAASVGRSEPEVYLSNNVVNWRSTVLNRPDISVLDAAAVEGSKQLEASVVLSNPSNQEVSVGFSLRDGTATSTDYVAATGRIVFPPGTTNQSIRVVLLDDKIDEQDETFSIVLSQPVNGLIAQGEATGTILDDDGPDLVFEREIRVAEGNAGVGEVVINFTLSLPSVQEVSFDLATADGTAQVDSDYAPYNDTVVFPAGETNATVRIGIFGDLRLEPDEFFTIGISNLVNATAATDQLKVVIVNDDGLPGELDTFLFDPLPPLIFAGEDQFVTILARDGFHNRAENFSGSAVLRAEEAVDALTVGSGNVAWDYPLGSFSPARMQSIFYTNELGSAFYIDSLALEATGVAPYLTPEIGSLTIRMKPSPRATFSGTSAWETNGWTTVFAGKAIPLKQDGWVRFSFPDPFYYDGTNHLMVDFITVPGLLFTGGAQIEASAVTGNRSMAAEDVITASDPATWTGRRPTPTLYQRIPNIQLSGNVPIPLASTTNLQFKAGLWQGSVQLLGTAGSLRLKVRDVIGHAGASDLVALAAPVDSDGDGLPDAWERLFSLNPADSSDAAQDLDHDGSSNLQEYLAGTTANDARDALEIYSATLRGNALVISVIVVPGRSYVVERTNRLGGPWTEFARISAVDSDLYEISDSVGSSSGQAFYRFRLAR